MSESKVNYRLYHPNDFSSYVKLYSKVFGKSMSKEYFEWKFCNTNNPAVIFCAFNKEGAMVGSRVILITKLTVAGNQVKGAQSVDSMVDPDYRGMGIYKQLNLMALKELEKMDVKLIYTFPNDQSFPPLKKLGWREITPINIRVKVLSLEAVVPTIPFITPVISFLDKMMKTKEKKYNNKIQEIQTFNKSHEDFMYTALKNKTHQSRTKEYLNWKYVEKPFDDYILLEVKQQEKAAAIFVIRKDHVNGIIKGTILESVVNEDLNVKQVYKDLFAYLRKKDFDIVRLWESEMSNSKLYTKLGLGKRKSTLKFTVKEIGKLGLEQGVWHISAGDADTA